MKKKALSVGIAVLLVGQLVACGTTQTAQTTKQQVEAEVSAVETSTVQEIQEEKVATSASQQSEVETVSEPETVTEIETETETETQEVATSVEAQSEEATKEIVEETTTKAQALELTVKIRGQKIAIGDDMAKIEAALGAPDDYSAAASCLGVGEDKVYSYDGFVIYTQPLNGKDLVYIIEMEAGATLPSGIGVGSSKNDLIAAYGDIFQANGQYLEYSTNGMTISFEMAQDKITFVEIF